jgi:hypothetical protein
MRSDTAKVTGTGTRLRVPLANLPAPLSHVRRAVLSFRRVVEDALEAAGTTIGPYQASVIGTACIALREHMRCDRLMRDHPLPGAEGATLSVEQWLALSDRVVKHKQAVDSALAKLGLDKDNRQDCWDILYATPPAQLAHQDAPSPPAGPTIAEDAASDSGASSAAAGGATGQDAVADGGHTVTNS